MKTLALFLMTIFLGSAATFTSSVGASGHERPFIRVGSVSPYSGCDGGKREVTSNGVQVRLEICGSDRDGFDIDASNPDTGKKWDCSYEFALTGKTKDKGESVDVSRKGTITVSSTATGWFNATGESGMKEGKDFKISSFSVSCS